MFKRFFDSRARDLLDLYERTGELEHGGEKGALRELVLRRLIATLLPPHFGIGTGVIVDKWNRQSRQSDLIIYDRRRLPPLLLEESRGIFPLDAVLRVVEVKSVLDRKGLEAALAAAWLLAPENSEGLKMAMTGHLPNGYSRYPVSALFAFSSSIAEFAQIRSEILPASVPSFQLACILPHGVAQSDRLDKFVTGSREACIRCFICLLLQNIESDAASRKDFSLIEWLL